MPGITIREHMTPVAYAVADDQNLAEVSFRMQELGVRHLPVMRGSKLVGIISERDVATLKATSNAHLHELTVVQAMTRDPYTVGPSASLSEVAQTMADHRYGAAIIVHAGEVQGIFTTTDGLRVLAQLASLDPS